MTSGEQDNQGGFELRCKSARTVSEENARCANLLHRASNLHELKDIPTMWGLKPTKELDKNIPIRTSQE